MVKRFPYLNPNSAAWFWKNGERTAVRVESRQGGVYRLRNGAEVFLANVKQVSLRHESPLQGQAA